MVPDELVKKYSWVTDPKLEAWTVAVIADRTIGDVIRTYGGDPTAPLADLRFWSIDEHRDNQFDRVEFFVQVLTRGSHVVVVENDGYSGSFPEIARRCSANGGQFFSVYWNVNAFGLVTQAIDGVLKSNFEMLWPFQSEPTNQWELRPEWAIGPEVDVEISRQVCMAQLEQQTGVEVDPAWLTTPLPTYQVPDPHWFYRDVPDSDR